MNRAPKVLVINPPIYDVAAYSFWSAPLGLLQVGAVLRESGMDVELLDCLAEKEEKRKDDGRAPFISRRAATPDALKETGKKFRRYGMAADEVERRLGSLGPPDLVLVTCVMTYWYPGAAEVAEVCRERFPGAKIVVGGIYPSLCYDHARKQMRGADLVVTNGMLDAFYAFVEESLSWKLALKPQQAEPGAFPFPAFDLYAVRHFVPLLTSFGCVYRCAYCATPRLYPRMARRRPEDVLAEIGHWHSRGVSRFVLYDDNFLFEAEAFARPILSAIGRLPYEISVYNPNGLNASLLDGETASLLAAAGFREVRLGLETADPVLLKRMGGKVTREGFARGVELLGRAGFSAGSIRAYVMAGLPMQRHEEARATIAFASALGVMVDLATYTPIPGTELFGRYAHLARYPIASEPLFQNNALFPFAWEGFTEADMDELKAYARAQRGNDVGGCV